MLPLTSKIRLVSFDLLHTLIVPRHPIHVQYARALEPFVGLLDAQALKYSLHTALRQLQVEKPLYGGDTTAWWSEVIRRTALGAGAEPKALDASLSLIVPRLMSSFSTKEAYKSFDNSLDVLHALHHDLGVHTAVVSNADSRMLAVLKDLNFPTSLTPIILSELEGVEKPSPEIFQLLLQRVNSRVEPPITPAECVHVGDELQRDGLGARNAGMNALLLKSRGGEDPFSLEVPIQTVENMSEILEWVRVRV
ncbi:HAD hydrolase subfamily IA REG-2-like protein [Mycena pura]|uniref:HAD hydrolase subfamily IA REG-2-like protein n=1 Tax=Mycena pura TaxID=153505 RepID=A0AAD6VR81_9AGAR|nr:HAD hydrolase subfamily IA REG-2-like protein [Mycena pura]